MFDIMLKKKRDDKLKLSLKYNVKNPNNQQKERNGNRNEYNIWKRRKGSK